MRYHTLTTDMIQLAGRKAKQYGHSYVGSAHLLLAMTRIPGGTGQLLESAGIRAETTEDMTQLLYGLGTADLPLPQGLSGEAKTILRGAAEEAKRQNCREILPVHVLLALARRENTTAARMLQLIGVDTVCLFSSTVDYMRWEQEMCSKVKKEAVSTKLLDQFSEDLISKASGMEPVIGRDREIDAVIGILCRKNKNNPALVGEPGV